MSFNLTILGCHSPPPKLNRNNSSQILEINNNLFLIDCAENTQVNLRKYNFGFQKIHSIFISHLHGDHYFGLPGLLSTFHLLGREKELDVFYDRQFHLDFLADYVLNPKIKCFIQINNITNQPLRYYLGNPSLTKQYEFYSWWGRIGLKANF